VFVSRINLESHPDKPEWFSKVDSGMMKIKLSLALVSISSIHLLRTFFATSTMSSTAILWQVAIHITLLLSVLAIAFANKFASH